MTSLTFAANIDTRSSPWVDYNTDTAYVGADDGNLYKITGVFNGCSASSLSTAWSCQKAS